MSASLEEEIWTEAALEVLEEGGEMHYLDIKRVILQRSLVGPGLKTTLESALYNEIKREGTRLKQVDGQSGVFTLQDEEMESEDVQPVPQQQIQLPTKQQLTPQQIQQIVLQQQKLQQQQQQQQLLQQHILAQEQSPKSKGNVQLQSALSQTQSKNLQLQRSQLQKILTKQATQGQGRKTKVKVKHFVRPAPIKPTNAATQLRYKSKYLKVKKLAKDMIFKNAALCDEVCEMEKKIAKARDERKFLLAGLLKHQPVMDVVSQSITSHLAAMATPPSPIATATMAANVNSPSVSMATFVTDGEKSIKGKKKLAKRKRDGMDDIPKARPRKSGKSGKRLVQPIPLDSTGRPLFPIELGDLTVHSLGEVVCERAGFHTVEHIYPAGFCSTQLYASIQNPLEQCLYTCKIVDEGQFPRFEISPDDHPGLVFSGATASSCHTKLLAAINYHAGMEIVTVQGHGPEFFGFSHPTIQNLIQSSHGARKCEKYKWVRFEVCKSEAEVPSFAEDEPGVSVHALYKSAKFRKYIEVKTGQQAGSASLRSLLTAAAADRS